MTADKDLLTDAIQDLFVEVYKYGSKLRHPEYIEFYLIKSFKRIIIKKIKENQKLNLTDDLEHFDLKFYIEDFSEKEALEQNIQMLQAEIKNLDAKKREMLFLKFKCGLTYSEIGKILEINPETVKKQMQRLLKSIQNRLINK